MKKVLIMLLILTMIGGIILATMEIVKGHCGDSKCTYDVYTKEKVDELLLNQNTNVTDEYSSSSTYTVGDLIIYDNALYTCNTEITEPEEWNIEHWTLTSINSELKNVNDKFKLKEETLELEFSYGVYRYAKGSSSGTQVFSGNITLPITFRKSGSNVAVIFDGIHVNLSGDEEPRLEDGKFYASISYDSDSYDRWSASLTCSNLPDKYKPLISFYDKEYVVNGPFSYSYPITLSRNALKIIRINGNSLRFTLESSEAAADTFTRAYELYNTD